ncbi:MAG: hypothetical protein HOP10_04770 [Chitinophagaceae bacterium]|nr:hypothetical protein [Chitinophagaceae bacterium]
MKTLPFGTRMPVWQRFFSKNSKVVFLAIAFVLVSASSFAHSVSGYTGGCITGPQYSLDATVVNVNSSSNYAWQYKNSSGNWVCIVNGNNTINGFVYSVSGATSTATTNPAPIVFNNPNSGLHGLIIRCVISDGSGVNPCNMPSGNTWNSGTSSVNHTISVNNTPCGGTVCTGEISSLYFNKLDGGTDISITNGGTYTTNQLGSLYNLETSTIGTVGSIKYTITGPTSGSNVENAVPYNHPGTGSGAWVPAPGSYTINVKLYSAADATGTLCDEANYTITISNDCDCPGNVLTNGSFENSASGWTVSGGTLTFGQSYEMCGSYNGFLNHSSGTAKVYQDVTVSAGSVLSFKGYAGTHQPGLACSPKLSLIFYNSANAVISQSDANVTYDVGSGSTLALYTIDATAPAGTVKVRVQGSITCNTLKVDGFCLTVTPGVPNCQNTNETFPNQFNTGFSTNLNSTFTGSTGTWSATSNAGATIVVTTPYYSPSTSHAIKIVNWKTNGTNNGFSGTGTATATSPTVNLGSGVCCPASLEMIFTLWTYTCTSGDNKASVALQFYNGTSWVTVWTKTSGELFSAYGANGKTNITVAIPAAYQNSSFKYRFTGTSTSGNANNFYLFIDDIKISSTPCPLGNIGDFVWQDLNSDGDQDANEPGIQGVVVTLRNSSNAVVATTETNANGGYNFPNLNADTYSVEFTTPAGYLPTPVANGETIDDALDSDPVNGIVPGIVLPAGGSNTTIDAGFVKLINISGNVWHDVNAMTDNLVNNTGPLQTPPAVAIPANLRAYLVNMSTGLVEKITAINPANGQFAFTDVTPNTTYYVLISSTFGVLNVPPPPSTLPSGWSHTGQKLGSPVLTGHDGLNDGRLIVPVVTSDVNNINFGIKIAGGDVVIG